MCGSRRGRNVQINLRETEDVPIGIAVLLWSTSLREEEEFSFRPPNLVKTVSIVKGHGVGGGGRDPVVLTARPAHSSLGT